MVIPGLMSVVLGQVAEREERISSRSLGAPRATGIAEKLVAATAQFHDRIKDRLL